MALNVNWDIRTVPKAEAFSGKEEDWNEWSFTFRSYVYMLGASELLEQLEREDTAPVRSDMMPEVRRQGEMMYHVLVQLLKGKARRVAMKCERGNGFDSGGICVAPTRAWSLDGIKLC